MFVPCGGGLHFLWFGVIQTLFAATLEKPGQPVGQFNLNVGLKEKIIFT